MPPKAAFQRVYKYTDDTAPLMEAFESGTTLLQSLDSA